MKMRSCCTAGVDKRRLLTFCLGCSSFWLQSSASVTADFHEWVLFFVLFFKKKTFNDNFSLCCLRDCSCFHDGGLMTCDTGRATALQVV